MALPLSYNVRNLVVRWRVTTLAIGAIALVVAVLVVLVTQLISDIGYVFLNPRIRLA